MKQKWTLLGLCAVMAMMVANASARGQGKPSFDSLDADKDGKISLKEFKKLPSRRGGSPESIFKMKDKDQDGFLSKDEFEAQPSRRGGGSRGR